MLAFCIEIDWITPDCLHFRNVYTSGNFVHCDIVVVENFVCLLFCLIWQFLTTFSKALFPICWTWSLWLSIRNIIPNTYICILISDTDLTLGKGSITLASRNFFHPKTNKKSLKKLSKKKKEREPKRRWVSDWAIESGIIETGKRASFRLPWKLSPLNSSARISIVFFDYVSGTLASRSSDHRKRKGLPDHVMYVTTAVAVSFSSIALMWITWESDDATVLIPWSIC